MNQVAKVINAFTRNDRRAHIDKYGCDTNGNPCFWTELLYHSNRYDIDARLTYGWYNEFYQSGEIILSRKHPWVNKPIKEILKDNIDPLDIPKLQAEIMIPESDEFTHWFIDIEPAPTDKPLPLEAFKYSSDEQMHDLLLRTIRTLFYALVKAEGELR